MLWFVFLGAVVAVLFSRVAAGLCENNCSGPPSLSDELAFLIIGTAFVAGGATAYIRWRNLFGMVLWMAGTVLILHGILITVHPVG